MYYLKLIMEDEFVGTDIAARVTDAWRTAAQAMEARALAAEARALAAEARVEELESELNRVNLLFGVVDAEDAAGALANTEG